MSETGQPEVEIRLRGEIDEAQLNRDGKTVLYLGSGDTPRGGTGGNSVDTTHLPNFKEETPSDDQVLAYVSGNSQYEARDSREYPEIQAGDSLKVLRVNSGETGVEWATGGGGGVTDHGALTGLEDDDHSLYHNDTRGDARYYQQSEHINSSAGAGDAGKPIVLDAAGHVDATMVNDADIDHGSLSGTGDDDHSQYHNDARGDARYYTQTELDTYFDTREVFVPIGAMHDVDNAGYSTRRAMVGGELPSPALSTSRWNVNWIVPPDWKASTSVTFDILYWKHTGTTGNIAWARKIAWTAVGEVVQTNTTTTVTQSAPSTLYEITEYSFSETPGAVGDLATIQIARNNAADTLAGLIVMYGVKITYTRDDI